MTSKQIRTKKEDRSAADEYFTKSKDNIEAMVMALKTKNYNAVGTLAVQGVISAADAICVKEKGLRSISQDHGDLCELVCNTYLKEAKEKSRTLKRIIAKKNVIQYERRNISANEANELSKLALRFFEWVKSNF